MDWKKQVHELLGKVSNLTYAIRSRGIDRTVFVSRELPQNLVDVLEEEYLCEVQLQSFEPTKAERPAPRISKRQKAEQAFLDEQQRKTPADSAELEQLRKIWG